MENIEYLDRFNKFNERFNAYFAPFKELAKRANEFNEYLRKNPFPFLEEIRKLQPYSVPQLTLPKLDNGGHSIATCFNITPQSQPQSVVYDVEAHEQPQEVTPDVEAPAQQQTIKSPQEVTPVYTFGEVEKVSFIDNIFIKLLDLARLNNFTCGRCEIKETHRSYYKRTLITKDNFVIQKKQLNFKHAKKLTIYLLQKLGTLKHRDPEKLKETAAKATFNVAEVAKMLGVCERIAKLVIKEYCNIFNNVGIETKGNTTGQPIPVYMFEKVGRRYQLTTKFLRYLQNNAFKVDVNGKEVTKHANNGQVHYLPSMTSDVIANLSALEFDVLYTLFNMLHSAEAHEKDKGIAANVDTLINYFMQIKAPAKNNIPLFKKELLKAITNVSKIFNIKIDLANHLEPKKEFNRNKYGRKYDKVEAAEKATGAQSLETATAMTYKEFLDKSLVITAPYSVIAKEAKDKIVASIEASKTAKQVKKQTAA